MCGRRTWGALAILAAAAGCGDDTTGTGGGGGASSSAATTTSTVGVSTSVASSSSAISSPAATSASTGGEGGETSASTGEGGSGGQTGSGGDGGTGGEGGGPPACVPITIDEDGVVNGAAFQIGTTFTPALGDADTQDALGVRFSELEGDFSLDSVINDNLATCHQCVLVLEDSDGTLAGSGRVFFQSGGLMAVTETDEGPRATISGLTLVEITVGDKSVSTPVPGGACLTLDVATLQGVDPGEWTCQPAFYGDGQGCDCNCGILDPDCADETQQILGCGPPHFPGDGPACDPDGSCGAPSDWTCDADAYGDGETCDCDCGAPDSDCTPQGLPVVGCDDGEVCAAGQCVEDTGWTCQDAFFNDGQICDCMCGIYDPDCDIPGAQIFGCDAGAVCLPDATCGIPDSWECDDDLFGDGSTCDCECGGSDPDCLEGLPVVGCDDGEACLAGSCGTPVDNDACAGAPPLTEGTVVGSWVGSTNDLSPQNCTGFPEAGGDVFYSVSLEAGQTLTVSIDQATNGVDSALYLLSACTSSSCVIGEDTNPNTPESISFTAPEAMDLILGVDQFQAATVQTGFVLTVDIQ